MLHWGLKTDTFLLNDGGDNFVPTFKCVGVHRMKIKWHKMCEFDWG